MSSDQITAALVGIAFTVEAAARPTVVEMVTMIQQAQADLAADDAPAPA